MTGDRDKFKSLVIKDGATVTFGGNQSGKITGVGEVGPVKDVYLVDGLCHNLLSVSQSTDKGNWVIFDSHECIIVDKQDLNLDKANLKCKLKANRNGNLYTLDLCQQLEEKCLISSDENSWLWHKRLAHVNFTQLDMLIKKELAIGIPSFKVKHDFICESCQRGKQTKSSFKTKKKVSTSRPLELIHMDLVGPARVKSLGGNLYALVVVDDYSRFTWTMFLASKQDTFDAFVVLAKKVQNERELKITAIRTDHGGEFENHSFSELCEQNDIEHNFSAPRTPQQNEVVERKNRVLTEMARSMLNEKEVSQVF